MGSALARMALLWGLVSWGALYLNSRPWPEPETPSNPKMGGAQREVASYATVKSHAEWIRKSGAPVDSLSQVMREVIRHDPFWRWSEGAGGYFNGYNAIVEERSNHFGLGFSIKAVNELTCFNLLDEHFYRKKEALPVEGGDPWFGAMVVVDDKGARREVLDSARENRNERHALCDAPVSVSFFGL